jgi:hypothetical protein
VEIDENILEESSLVICSHEANNLDEIFYQVQLLLFENQMSGSHRVASILSFNSSMLV